MDTSRASARSRAVVALLIVVVVAVGGATTPAAAAPPAAPTITAAPAGPGASRAPAWSFTGDPGATFECRLRRGVLVIDAWSPCPSPVVADLSGAPDGVYAMEVRGVLGIETGPAATGAYVLDTTPPAAPVLTGAPPATGNDPFPSWTFVTGPSASITYDAIPHPLPPSLPSIAYAARSTAEVGDLISLAGSRRRLDSVSVTLEDWAAHSDFPTYPAGSWSHPITVRVYAVDRSGSAPAPGPLVATAVQTVAIPWRPEPDASCPASGPYVGFRGSDGQCHFSVPTVATFDLRSLGVDLPDEVIVSVAFDTQDSGAAPLGVSGPYNMLNLAVVSGTAPVGANVEPDAVFYNSTFAGFYADGGAGGTGVFRRDTGWGTYTPAIEVVTTDVPGPPDAIECRLTRGAVVVADWAPCTTSFGVDLGAAPDGTYTLAARATDAAGNAGPATTVDYILDRSAPGAPTLTSVPASPSAMRHPSWAFVGDAATAGLECRLTGPSPRPWTSCSSPASIDLSTGIDGTYGFEVRARNSLGTAGPPAQHVYELDTTPPPAPTVTSAPGSPGTGRSPTWAFTVETGAAAECQLERSGVVVSPWDPCSSPHGVELGGAPTGSYVLSIRARDVAGNTGPAATAGYELRSPPVPGGSGPGSGPSTSPGRSLPPAGPQRPVAPPATPAVVVPEVAAPTEPATGGGRSRSTHGSGSAGGAGDRGSWLSRILAAIRRAVTAHADEAAFPGSVLLLVAAFLALQDRIDRNDPKLALAPVHADPDLTFPPPPGGLS